jgi:hypothetical protein
VTAEDDRRKLLTSLELYNEALIDNGARLLVTVDQVATMPITDLAVIVESVSRHLADIVQAATWRS